MRTKKVNRYYCDYCKKSGCSKFHLENHERHCTMNPNRECGMCKTMGEDPAKMEDMLRILPDGKEFTNIELLDKAIGDALPRLRGMTGSCPACMLAALRQKGLTPFGWEEFDYKKEREMFWQKQNVQEPEYY